MTNKKNDDDDDGFFNDMLDDENIENENINENEEPLDETEFDFEDEVFEVPEIKKLKVGKPAKEYKRTKNDIQHSVEELQVNINSMLSTIEKHPDDMFAEKDLLPGLNLEIENHDYDKEIELIKIESKETLECLASLYLSENAMKNKNVYKIIKDDSSNLSKLNFSINMGQKSLIGCMKQLDMGVNDPDMYQAVTMFMKEIRDNVKMAYELQRKMKDFYKELKEELSEINTGDDIIDDEDEENMTIIGDPNMLNDLFDELKKDPTLLESMLNDKKKKK